MEIYFLIGLYSSIFWIISFIFNFIVLNIQDRQKNILECLKNHALLIVFHIFLWPVFFILAFTFLLFINLDKNIKNQHKLLLGD